MPNETVGLTEVELELLRVFVNRKIIDGKVVNILKELIRKLES